MGFVLRGIAFGLLFAAAPAGAVSFTKIVGGTAEVWYRAPAVDGGLVAFAAARIGTDDFGIYAVSGGTLTTIADSSMSAPGDSGTFSDFGAPGVSGGNVAFAAESRDAADTLTSFGIYASFGGAPMTEVVATSYPLSAGALIPQDNIRSVALQGTNVAFAGGVFDGVNVSRAIYTSGAGGPEVIVDSTTPLPNGNTPFFLSAPVSIDSTGVAFWAEDYDDYPDGRHEGIYVAGDAVTRAVVDTSMLAPHTGDPFVAVRLGDSDSGNTVFGGSTLTSPTTVSPMALYAEIGGVLMWIADAPAGQFFDSTSIHGDRVAWRTSASCPFVNGCPQAIQVYVDGQRYTVIQGGDVLDGRVVDGLSFGFDAISGDQLAFAVNFTDGASAVYVADLATIPEPGTALLLATGLLALAAARRPRSAA